MTMTLNKMLEISNSFSRQGVNQYTSVRVSMATKIFILVFKMLINFLCTFRQDELFRNSWYKYVQIGQAGDAKQRPHAIWFDTSSSQVLPCLKPLNRFLLFNPNLDIRAPQRYLSPVSKKLTLNKLHNMYYFEHGAPTEHRASRCTIKLSTFGINFVQIDKTF